jgi:hypothetical protein
MFSSRMSLYIINSRIGKIREQLKRTAIQWDACIYSNLPCMHAHKKVGALVVVVLYICLLCAVSNV